MVPRSRCRYGINPVLCMTFHTRAIPPDPTARGGAARMVTPTPAPSEQRSCRQPAGRLPGATLDLWQILPTCQEIPHDEGAMLIGAGLQLGEMEAGS